MDAKITKLRLSRMLSYDWVKIVAIIAGAIFLWVFIFTATATRITPAQQFTVMNYDGNLPLTTGKLTDFYISEINNDKFSNEVFEITVADMTTNSEYGHTVLQARTEMDEGDVIFVSKQPDASTAYEENGVVKYSRTYLDSLVNGYWYLMYDLDRNAEDGFFKKMEGELNKYYDGGYVGGTLSKEKAEALFRERIERTGDKRYKNEEQIAVGIADEVDRVQKYRDALVRFDKHLADGTVALEKTTIYANDEVYKEGYYSINLCPGESMKKLSNYIGYVKEEEVEGEVQQKMVAENMQICLWDLGGIEDCFRYEALIFVVDLIDTVLAA